MSLVAEDSTGKAVGYGGAGGRRVVSDGRRV